MTDDRAAGAGRSGWSRRLAWVIPVVAVTVFGGARAVTFPPDEVEGTWVLQAWETGGERVAVEQNVNTPRPIWVKVDATGVHGDDSCNRFSLEGYEIGGRVWITVVDSTLAGCPPVAAEQAVRSVLLTAQRSTIAGDGTMLTWSAGDTTLIFAPADRDFAG